MKNFRDLKVWHKAHALTLETYRLSASFPSDERYNLTAQLRRSAASIPSNIAEGCGRTGDREFKRFLQIAMGSASELEYQLLLSRDLEYMKEESYSSTQAHLEEVKKMLAGLIKKLAQRA